MRIRQVSGGLYLNCALLWPTTGPMSAEQRLEQFLASTCERALAGDAAGVGSAFREASAWREPQRAYEAIRSLCQLVLDTGAFLHGGAAAELYGAAAEALAEILEREPAEPVLLNAAGVFLYELKQYDAAVAVFECALALDPALPAAESNLAAALDHGASGNAEGASREVAHRLCEAAAAAAAATGMTVSLCMIVKDEEDLLQGCLEAVASAVDEIVIVDTGSTDRTVEIAQSFGARILYFPWNGSFSDARNVALEAATGDWLLCLDADERLIDGDATELRALLGRTWREGFFLELRNLTGDASACGEVVHPALRLIRNRPEYRFVGRIHEEVTGAMPTFLPERFEQTSVRAFHLGYLDLLVEKRQKSARNLELLELESNETPGPYVSFNLGSEYQRLGSWLIARRHFDEAWAGVSDDVSWPLIGFGPLLALRTARARRECGRIDDARQILECALEQLPGYTDLVFELAQCAIDAGDQDEAERLLELCLELGDAPAGLPSTIGAGSHLAQESLELLRRRPDLTPSR